MVRDRTPPKAANPVRGDACRVLGATPERVRRGAVLRAVFWAAAICLVFAGCGAMRAASPGSSGLGPFPTWVGSKSSDQSLIKAVQRDPFPRADEGDFQVRVGG